MHKITVIGLGSEAKDLSLQAFEVISSHKNVIARTALTNSYKALNKDIKSLDFIYQKSRNFDTLNKNLAKEIIKEAKIQPVCYLVDGAATEDNSVKYILEAVKDVEIYAGVSAATKCLERLKMPSVNCLSISAYDIESNYSLSLPLVVYAIDSRVTASKVKLFLGDLFGEEITAYVAGNDFAKKIELYELDRLDGYDYSLSLYLPKLELTEKQRFDFNDLMAILKILRSENGCPWDREQTEFSIRENVIEEAYELVDAVDNEDDDMIIEETGDVILQAAFYANFGEEGGRFSRSDVLSGICSKLITRHTHVFGADAALGAEDALSVWNKNKAVEKKYSSGEEYLRAVPSSLPAVMRAEKVGKRAGKYNFDFSSVEQVFDKILEEIKELKTAILSGETQEIENECGDLLFSAVNAVRKVGVEGELALKKSTEKFINRFSKLEKEVKTLNKNLTDLSLEELDEIYEKVKG